MRNCFFSLLGILALVGCAHHPYGNYAALSPSFNQQLADTTVKQLIKLYPPAQTRFLLNQPVADAFGVRLFQRLRAQGYAVQEPAATMTAKTPGIDFQYVVDRLVSTSLYRVTLWTGSQSLSRAFMITPEGKLSPVGSWVHKGPS